MDEARFCRIANADILGTAFMLSLDQIRLSWNCRLSLYAFLVGVDILSLKMIYYYLVAASRHKIVIYDLRRRQLGADGHHRCRYASG